MIATPTSIEPAAPFTPHVSPPHPLTSITSITPSPTPALSPHDESLLFSLLESGPSLAHLIRQHKMTLDQALAWWRQPHIKRALAELADLSQARAKAIASNDAMNAVNALQSCLVLCDTEFYEQADPKTRLKAFDSARKAAVQVLRLAGIGSRASRAITRGSARVMPPTHTTNGAITRGSARVMPPTHSPAGAPLRPHPTNCSDSPSPSTPDATPHRSAHFFRTTTSSQDPAISEVTIASITSDE